MQKKGKRYWVYLSEQDEQRLNKLVDSIGTLSAFDVLSVIASAGLKASEESGHRLPLPLGFQIHEAAPVSYGMNEPRPPATHKPRK
jgi:hypothetical protein